MKKGFVLLLVVASSAAFANPGTRWLDVSAGTASIDYPSSDTGRSLQLAGAFPVADSLFLRADLARERVDFQPRRASGLLDPNVSVTEPEFEGNMDRDLATLTFGYFTPLASWATFSAEGGAARFKRAGTTVHMTDDGAVINVSNESFSSSTFLFRAGLDGEINQFTWGVGAEWFNEEPTVFFGSDCIECGSATWWNLRLGYRLSEEWNVGLRYRDSNDFNSVGASLRWGF